MGNGQLQRTGQRCVLSVPSVGSMRPAEDEIETSSCKVPRGVCILADPGVLGTNYKRGHWTACRGACENFFCGNLPRTARSHIDGAPFGKNSQPHPKILYSMYAPRPWRHAPMCRRDG